MTNSDSNWGGQLLFKRCPKFQISGFMKTSASSVGQIFSSFHLLCFFLKLGSQEYEKHDYFNFISTYPSYLPNIFSSLGSLELANP